MNPQIVHPEGNPGDSYLVDLHSVVTARDNGHNGKSAQIALHAISIKHLRAGEIAAVDGRIHPQPCQLVAWEGLAVRNPLWRGIYPDAATALLTMPHGMKDDVSPGRDIKLGRPAPGFNKWPFLTAWGWSLWQDLSRRGEDWPLERRWQEMKHVGYSDSFGAFRQVCSRLKLSVTKSGPNL